MRLPVGLLACASLIAACRRPEAPPPLERRITWEGTPPAAHASFPAASLPIDSAARRAGIPDSTRLSRHEFLFGGADSIRLALTEFSRDYWAFAAAQAGAEAGDPAEGFQRRGEMLRFHHGPFLGELAYPGRGLVPASFLKERLSFASESLFRRPAVFSAFPLTGRIENTESVIIRHFLGRENWNGPAFCVRYICHEDTAIAFRGFAQSRENLKAWFSEWKGETDTLRWPRELRFKGVDELGVPLVFHAFSDGSLGFWGCYDSALAQGNVEKMQKMNFLLPHL